MTDDWMNVGMITEMLDMLDRHGYARGDDEHCPGHRAHQRPGAHLPRLPGPPVRPLHQRGTAWDPGYAML